MIGRGLNKSQEWVISTFFGYNIISRSTDFKWIYIHIRYPVAKKDILWSKNILDPDPFVDISTYPVFQMDIYQYHISNIWIYIPDIYPEDIYPTQCWVPYRSWSYSSRFFGSASKWTFRNLEFLRDFGLELWKNPWVFDKFVKISSKTSIFMGILNFWAKIAPRVSDFLSFWTKNSWVCALKTLSLSFWDLEFFSRKLKNPALMCFFPTKKSN